MNIVIVGHVDHGKSTLIGRLLYDTNSIPESIVEDVRRASTDGVIEFAYFLDCLEEERAQNITIDTTQTFFKTPKRHYIIIDAPGHTEFLKNMVTGASRAEAAILMLDASRGIEEQTRRHAFILKLLGVDQLVVAVNKMDAANYDTKLFSDLRDQISEFLTKVGLAPKAILPVAARTGENIAKRSTNLAWHDGPTLLELLDGFAEGEDISAQDLRYSVQDLYEIDGKTLIAGRVESGTLKSGAEVVVLPSNQKAVIKTVETMEGEQETAATGYCVGVTLVSPVKISRGDILSSGKLPQMTSALQTVVFSMGEHTITPGESLICQCGTQSVECTVETISQRLNSSTLEVSKQPEAGIAPTEVGKVKIATKTPLVLEAFSDVPNLGRFVLVKNGDIQAAGIVQEL